MPRRDFSKVAFAATGDVNTIPSTAQPDGSVSLPSGWGFDYQRDNGAGGGTPDPLAKNIDREDMNGILNEITASIGEIQQNGYAIWVSTAAPYPINAKVRRNNINYRSLITNNSDEPSVGAGATSWAEDDALPSGRLLRTTIYRNVAGALQSSVDGGAFSAAASTFTASTLTTRVRVLCQGGGGAGGLASSTPAGQISLGSGGAGGGWCEKILTSGFNGAAVAVGAGGIPSGAAAGTTSFGATLSAPGGPSGGVGPSAASNPSFVGGTGGGTGTGGDVNGQGGNGGSSWYGSTPISGKGGGSIFGEGAYPVGATGVAGNPAQSPGAGGSGAGNGASAATNKNGGAGASGLIKVEEYA